MSNFKFIKFLTFLLGLTSTISQILLLRECVTIFYGNETTYALILGSWLFWIAMGSFCVSVVSRKIKNPLSWIVFSCTSVSFLLPLTIFIIRILKQILHVPVGEMLGIAQMGISTFILIAPLSFIFGGIYSLLCLLYGKKEQEGATHVSLVYFWEALGSAAGGLVFSFVLIHMMSSFAVAFLLAVVNMGALCFLKRKMQKGPCWGEGILLGLLMVAFISGCIQKIDRFSRDVQWAGFPWVEVQDSLYGNLAIAKLGSTYNFYQNGLLSFSTRDALSSEESVHFALLEHPNPQKVLLIGNGLGGTLKEILKYSKTTVDYVELDPKILSFSKRFLPKEHTAVLENNPRVHVFHLDARLFLKSTRYFYDVIIVNLSDPYTALINRYYTVEFFKEALGNLKSPGILSLNVSSSENYINDETRSFLRTIYTSLKHVYPDVISIPGDNNIFIAGDQRGMLTQDPRILISRMKERNIKTRYVREYYIPFKMSLDRMEYIDKELTQEGELNTDMRPIAYLYDILMWSGHFNNGFKKLFGLVSWVTLKHLLLVPILFLILGLLLMKGKSSFPVSLSIVTTGFSEIIFQVIIIIAFQSLYGYAYYRIGLIVASFMLGLVGGCYYGRKVILYKPQQILRIYNITQAFICLYPLLLPVVFVLFRDIFSSQSLIGFFSVIFAFLPSIAGFMGGMQYPLAVVIRETRFQGNSYAKTAGFLYAADVFGASVGAVLSAAFLIPLLGIKDLSIFCCAINFTVLILLVRGQARN